MFDSEKLNKELEKFTLEDVLEDSEKLDKLFKLLSIKQALVQIEQAKAQTEFFESMTKAQNKVDSNMLSELLQNNSVQDLMDKLTKS